MPAFRPWALAAAALALGLAGCRQPDGAAAPNPASAEPARAEAALAPTDLAQRRAQAERALSAQRLYAPAGDSAIEHFLMLRDSGGADTSVETALLELLPYAVIGCEQALARQDVAEARRLVGLIERVDARLPSLARLTAALDAAELALAQQNAEQAQAEQDRLLQAASSAEPAPAGAASAPSPALAPASEPALAALPPPAAAPTPAQTAIPAPTPSAPPVATTTASSTAATTPASAPASGNASLPALISAPPPRYPLTALRRKIEGDVTVAFTIRSDGSVASPRVVAATKPGLFDQAALAAASRWRFQAGAAPTEATRQLRFRLADAESQASSP